MSATAAPPFVLVYGASGCGKTTDMIFSFPRCLFLAAPGALKSAKLAGYEPSSMPVDTFQDVTALLPQVRELGYAGVVIDDASFLAENTVSAAQAVKRGFDVWNTVRDVVLDFRAQARKLDLLVALNCWETDIKLKDTTPKERDGTKKQGVEENTFARMRGGPLLPMNLRESLSAMCDNVFRAIPPLETARGNLWQGKYLTRGNEDWIGKNRDANTPDEAPMNLGEILRLAGYPLPYYEDWMGEEVTRIADSRPEAKEDKKYFEAAFQELIGRDADPKIASWIVRDAYHRTQLLRSQEKRWSTFF